MTTFVVCIYSGPWNRRRDGKPHPNSPKKGRVYTVIRARTNDLGHRMVKLAEIKEGWFRAIHFRPVQYDLTQLLTDQREPVDE